MGGWSIGRAFGIPVRVHWSLLLLGAVVGLTQGLGAIGTLIGAVLLFASVVAHEIGHALVARSYGIETRDIVLTPIGGVARLEGMPATGRAEVAIALAGPAVSLAIAAAAWAAGTWLVPGLVVPGLAASGLVAGLLSTLAWTNGMLGVFNLLPAFPMDGGRVLRGVLHERIGLGAATELAATIGRGVALVMGAIGLFTANVSLALIAFFVWSASGRERNAVRRQEAWARRPRAWDAYARPIPVEIVPLEAVPAAWPRRRIVVTDYR